MSYADEMRQEIRGTLEYLGATQGWLARRVGWSEKHVSAILTGKAGLSMDAAEMMLGACGRKPLVHTEWRELPDDAGHDWSPYTEPCKLCGLYYSYWTGGPCPKWVPEWWEWRDHE